MKLNLARLRGKRILRVEKAVRRWVANAQAGKVKINPVAELFLCAFAIEWRIQNRNWQACDK